MRPTSRSSIIAAVAIAAACATAAAPGSPGGAAGASMPSVEALAFPPPADTPRLVVLITVDQLRGDYYGRHRSQLTGGLKRLFEGGAVFERAYQDHANTETAPGHASTLSGRFPSHTGIVSNSAGVSDAQAPLVGGIGPGASPFRFRGGTLTDWMRLRDPRTRALSVSGKDRGAILPLGRSKQEAYWYAARNGAFVTSTYYRDTLPAWVKAFNARGLPGSHAGRAWTLLLPESSYPEPDSVPAESGGEGFTFPHVLSADPSQAAGQLPATPWFDEITLQLALAGVEAMGLGGGQATDVLAVSLSTMDYIGHRYGPESREVHDHLLRLDRALGTFLDSLGALVGAGKFIVALTADHGVAPLPGTAAGVPIGQGVDLGDHRRRIRAELAARGVDTQSVRFEDGALLFDRFAFRRARVNADSFVRAFAADLRRDPRVHRVHTRREIRMAGDDDVIGRRWAHMIPADMPVELVATLKPYDLWAPVRYAQHGSPHDYDAHVPLVFYGPGFRIGRYAEMARTVDLAPTLAARLGVTPAEPLDGRVLRAALPPE